jgi:hypothetical protein
MNRGQSIEKILHQKRIIVLSYHEDKGIEMMNERIVGIDASHNELVGWNQVSGFGKILYAVGPRGKFWHWYWSDDNAGTVMFHLIQRCLHELYPVLYDKETRLDLGRWGVDLENERDGANQLYGPELCHPGHRHGLLCLEKNT